MYIEDAADPYDGIDYPDVDLWDSHVIDVNFGRGERLVPPHDGDRGGRWLRPLDSDGDWRVLGVDGTVIGTVTLSGRLVEGLCSVIDALDLETNAVLELRRDGDGNLLAVPA